MKEEEKIIEEILKGDKNTIQYRLLVSGRVEKIIERYGISLIELLKELGENETLRNEVETELFRYRRLEIIPEAVPYLVKGTDATTGESVIGFPYVFMKRSDSGGVDFCNVIFTPVVNDKDQTIDTDIPSKYGMAFPLEEMHIISGKMYKWIGKDENGINYFEGED